MPVYPDIKYFKVINETKETEIGYCEIADTFLSRFMGFMFKSNLDHGLVLKLPEKRSRRSSAIHMFFMRFPLDIIFADSQKMVVDSVSIQPWKVYTPKKPAKFIIELVQGTIASSKTEIGDILDFTCENV